MKTSTKVKKAIVKIYDEFSFELNNNTNRLAFGKALKNKLKDDGIDCIKVVMEPNDDNSLHGRLTFQTRVPLTRK